VHTFTSGARFWLAFARGVEEEECEEEDRGQSTDIEAASKFEAKMEVLSYPRIENIT
jgi:hypothetical protein